MKTLKELLTVRDSVFDDTKTDDVLDLSDLATDNIDVDRFFKETFFTDGMKLLLDTVFDRFQGRGGRGIIKLTQAMGGGKTHNMLTLGLTTKHPEVRKSILDGKYADFQKEVKVVAYTGRESDLTFGLWGEIARQLGKEKFFQSYYSPLKAPGQSAWKNLLKGDTPILILLDELPPYLQYSKSQVCGAGTVLDVTRMALANLFSALNKAELNNVCLVISDLRGTWEQGSQVMKELFEDHTLTQEVQRGSLDIEPVQQESDDLYHILRKRIFENEVSPEEIEKIALGYEKAVKDTRQMRLTDITPKEISQGIRNTYPFHPSIKNLFARFKENPNFQQTRGFIRLVRLMVKSLFREGGAAEKQYLINASDIDLNEPRIATTVKTIKSALDNAISSDIADKGKSKAEVLDKKHSGDGLVQEIAKLILVSSLSTVRGQTLGLTSNEVYAWISAPNKDIQSIKKQLQELEIGAWYLFKDTSNRLFFRDVKNVNAQLIDEIKGYTYEVAKAQLKIELEQDFEPVLKDCYQLIEVFPDLGRLELHRDKITLVITEPSKDGGGLSPKLTEWFETQRYQNRVMFLTGQRNVMENLIEKMKRYEAIKGIIANMRQENIPDSHGEMQQAKRLELRYKTLLSQAKREAFVVLYFPLLRRKGLELRQATFAMDFGSSNFNAEEEVRNVLIDKRKFEIDASPIALKSRFLDRLFTAEIMTKNDLLERAANNAAWQWHHPNTISNLIRYYVDTVQEWEQIGDRINKNPPPPEPEVSIREKSYNFKTGETTLELTLYEASKVHYEIGGEPTSASSMVNDLSAFVTSEDKLCFLAVEGDNLGRPQYWKKQLKISHKYPDDNDDQTIILECNSKNATVKYTTDGANPKTSGGVYHRPFTVPNDCQIVLAYAENLDLDLVSETITININKKFEMDRVKPVRFIKSGTTKSTKATFELLQSLKEKNATLVEFHIDFIPNDDQNKQFRLESYSLEVTNIEAFILNIHELNKTLFDKKAARIILTYETIFFQDGRSFEEWLSSKRIPVDVVKGFVQQ